MKWETQIILSTTGGLRNFYMSRAPKYRVQIWYALESYSNLYRESRAPEILFIAWDNVPDVDNQE